MSTVISRAMRLDNRLSCEFLDPSSRELLDPYLQGNSLKCSLLWKCLYCDERKHGACSGYWIVCSELLKKVLVVLPKLTRYCF